MTILIQSIVNQFDNNPVHACLRLINTVLVGIELDRRPNEYKKAFYRTGIEVIFILIIMLKLIIDLRFFAGYYKLY